MKNHQTKEMKSSLWSILGIGAVALLAAALPLIAQTPDFAQAQRVNAAALQQYEWKSRTEIQSDGETKRVQLALMRFDNHGDMQRTLLSSSPEPDLPTRGLRGMIAQKKKKEFKERIEELSTLARSYSELAPETMQRFMATATVTPELTVQHKMVRIEGRSVLHSGDSMTVWIDAASRKQRRVEIQTYLDKKLVRIVSEFQDLPQGGPTFVARSQVNYDGRELVIITENFDHARAQL